MYDNISESKILIVGSVFVLVTCWLVILCFLIRPLLSEQAEVRRLVESFDVAFGLGGAV